MHTETNATSVFVLLVATFLERFLFLVNSNNRKHQERYKKWLLSVPRLHLLLSTNPRKVLNFGHFKKTTEICESLLKQLTACESANPESIPRALFGTMLIKHSITIGCIWKSVQKSPGCHWGDSTSGKGTAMSVWEELHLDLPAPDGCLDNEFSRVWIWPNISQSHQSGLGSPHLSFSLRQKGSGNTRVARPCCRRQRNNPCQVPVLLYRDC